VSLLHRILFLEPHTCPWWFAYTFDNPLRRLVHDPTAILGGLVQPGQTAVDIGCGLGYWSMALAELVGTQGRVVALDVQAEMVRRARRRAEARGVADRIEFRQCEPDRLGFAGPADFVLAFWMVHEVRTPVAFLEEVRSMLRPAGRLLIAEPKGHVPAAHFERTLRRVGEVGFVVTGGPAIRFSRSALCSLSPG
jgi:ubiquinone/menaquinone biosynthesis C-methylase UbiE